MQLLPELEGYFRGSDGLPLAGGKIYAYIAGTTTNQATYTDSTGGAPNTNPVILDANGRADIWIDPGLAYKFVIKDSAGNPIRTVDGVQWIPSGSVTTTSLADKAVTTAKLDDLAVTTGKIDDQAVTTAKIEDVSITTTKIANEAVTQEKTKNFGLLPPGLMAPFGGEVAPDGWLVCDGISYLIADYPDLSTALLGGGTVYPWGSADATHFNVPDMRGRFLRGWDNGATNDPDAAGRTASAVGGPTGDHVGTLQPDGFASHAHNISLRNAGSNGAVPEGSGEVTSAGTGATASTGGSETRPKNATAQWIIKT